MPAATADDDETRFLSAATAETSTSQQAIVAYQFVSPEYFSLLEIEGLRGRGFAPGEHSPDAGIVVVSERVARQLWPERDPVGGRYASGRGSSRPARAGSSHRRARTRSLAWRGTWADPSGSSRDV